MRPKTVFLILTCIYLAYLYYQLFFNKFAVNNLVSVRASNGETYKVHAAHGDKKGAAELLAQIDDKIILLLKAMKKDQPDSPITQRLLANYNPDKIVENTPFNIFNFTSYTINKGEMIRYCLRSKNKSAILLNLNEMMFVAIHEVAHVGAIGYGHDRDFWRTFKVLLEKASEIGIYNLVDYGEQPFTYCGMNVSYNPYFDTSL